jgi:hypothetical protein
MHYPSAFNREKSTLKDRRIYESESDSKEDAAGVSTSLFSVSIMIFGLITAISYCR